MIPDMIDSCIICGRKEFKQILYQPVMPVCEGAPLKKQEIAKERVGKLDIVECQSCTHIFNKAVEPKIIEQIYLREYSSGLPNTKEMFNHFLSIASNAICDANIKGKVCLEIGASNFTFAKILLAKGARKVIAFEPSTLFSTDNPNIIHIQEYYSKDLVPLRYGPIELVVIRHVLEHMLNPVEILEEISALLNKGSLVYLEVPNVDDILKRNRIVDFGYEHISYFSPELLSKILVKFGFRVIKSTELVSGQHFGILARKDRAIKNYNLDFKCGISERAKNLRNLNLEKYRKGIRSILRERGRIAIYAAGQQGIITAVFLNLDNRKIKCFLDIDRLKANKYTPVTHIKIVQPSKEILRNLDKVIVAASLHQDEIYHNLRKQFDFKGEIYGIYPSIKKLGSVIKE